MGTWKYSTQGQSTKKHYFAEDSEKARCGTTTAYLFKQIWEEDEKGLAARKKCQICINLKEYGHVQRPN